MMFAGRAGGGFMFDGKLDQPDDSLVWLESSQHRARKLSAAEQKMPASSVLTSNFRIFREWYDIFLWFSFQFLYHDSSSKEVMVLAGGWWLWSAAPEQGRVVCWLGSGGAEDRWEPVVRVPIYRDTLHCAHSTLLRWEQLNCPVLLAAKAAQ